MGYFRLGEIRFLIVRRTFNTLWPGQLPSYQYSDDIFSTMALGGKARYLQKSFLAGSI